MYTYVCIFTVDWTEQYAVRVKLLLNRMLEKWKFTAVLFIFWQDGSVEYGIASTQLYPIHHLDDQEFFPGDFVIENKDESCMRVYGVVQSVDHAGRTARVKWFKTYTSQEEPR
jgi:ubiquitin-conjugating enzyme E2 O